MTPDMNPDLNVEVLRLLRDRCRVRLSEGRIWPEILDELNEEGYRPLDLKLVLRGMDAWDEQARLLKSDGWPYDEMVMHLVSLLATSPDIAKAMLSAGLRPPDMLRAALPEALGTGYQNSVIQMAMDSKQSAEDRVECRYVVAWWLGCWPE